MSAGECMSADYDDGWGASDYDDGWGARRLDGSVPRRVAHDDGWGVPAHQRAEQMRRVWPQHTGVKMRRVWGRLINTAQQDDGWGATTAQQAVAKLFALYASARHSNGVPCGASASFYLSYPSLALPLTVTHCRLRAHEHWLHPINSTFKYMYLIVLNL